MTFLCSLITSIGVDASKGGGTSAFSGAEPLTLTLKESGALAPVRAASKGVGSTAAAGAATGAATEAGTEVTGIDKACPRRCCAKRRAATMSLCLGGKLSLLIYHVFNL